MRVKVSRVSDLWWIYFCLQLTQLKKIEDEAPVSRDGVLITRNYQHVNYLL